MMTYGAMDLLAHERVQEARRSAERDHLADRAAEAARAAALFPAQGGRAARDVIGKQPLGLAGVTRVMRGRRHSVSAGAPPEPRATDAASGPKTLMMSWLTGATGTLICHWIECETVDPWVEVEPAAA
jgi:hypothetical protein